VCVLAWCEKVRHLASSVKRRPSDDHKERARRRFSHQEDTTPRRATRPPACGAGLRRQVGWPFVRGDRALQTTRVPRVHAVALHRIEPGKRKRHRLAAGPQVDDLELAGAVGRRRAHLFDEHGTGCLNGDAGQHGPDVSWTTPASDAWARAVDGRSTAMARAAAHVTNARIQRLPDW
jgi:hypothetical protein